QLSNHGGWGRIYEAKDRNNAVSRSIELICRINRTNSESVLDGRPLGDWVVERDQLMKKASVYREFANKAGSVVDRYSRSEILIIPTVNVKEYQKKADELAKEVRELDNKIQQANWNIDLL
ncbi:DIP1984 family protein, partial [uncultured Parasutterella sp.]